MRIRTIGRLFAQTPTSGGTPQVATPTFSPVAGSYGPTQNVTISSTSTPDAIYYTIDGSTPTNLSTLYTGPVAVASSLTLKALAVKSGYTDSAIGSAAYTINGQVATPTFSPVAGTYTGTQTVTVSCATAGASMFYTTDGSTPTNASTPYTVPISVTSSETIKVLATKTGFTDSAIGSAAYVITTQVATPTFSGTSPGSFTQGQSITLACATSGADIYYTTDGTTPDNTKTLYSGAFGVAVTTTVKAIGIKAGLTDSSILSGTYTLTLLFDGVTGAIAGYSSARLLRSAYNGSPLIRIRRSSDNTESDVGTDSQGNLNTTTITSFVGANNAFVTKFYDQSTNTKDCVQATMGAQPQIVAAGVLNTLLSKGAALFDGSNDTMVSVGLNSTATNSTLFTVCNMLSGTTDRMVANWGSSGTTGRTRGILRPAAGNAVGFAGFGADYTSASLTWDGSTGHLWGFTTTASAVVLYKDTTTTSGSAGTSLVAMNTADTAALGTLTVLAASFYYNGSICEMLLWPSALSGSDVSSIHTSVSTYYGTP